ncbi:MAG: acyl-CoA/acyl-ACP dehydrogenase [Deltaproteobacteria bacterium]|nr:acyl-CoA/acyl-ACP dehydrogenase [Deltaproteobacteria bacterium]
MDINLNEDQVEMMRQARRFCENETPMTFVREMFEDERGFTDDLWNKMVEMGWTAMLIPEQYGGLGMQMTDLMLVLMEHGRAVVPSPLFSTVLLGAEAIIAAGSDAQKEKYLTAIAEGSMRGTLALHEPGSGANPGYIQMEARKDGDGFILSGTKLFVTDAHAADFIVCPARTKAGIDPADGITLFIVDAKAPGVAISQLPVIDRTRKLCAIEFKNVKVGKDGILGEANKGWSPLCKVIRKACVGLAAECIGAAEKAMEIAIEYAKVRVQFDQPIGSFQAIKHRCAQMYVEVESGRSLLYYAAWAQDNTDEQEAAIAASAAKVLCTETGKNVAGSAIQVLGGIGFSWEHEIHFYLKRTKASELAFGDTLYHREQVVSLTT